MNDLKFKTSPFSGKVRGDEKHGIFEGYASVFNNVDKYDEVVMPGAFAKSLESEPKTKILWQHDKNSIIGYSVSLSEDSKGLLIEGKLLLEIQKGHEAYILMKEGAIDSLSIGYKLRDYEEKDGILYLTDIELLEVSPVTYPANTSARVTNVKYLDTIVLQYYNYIGRSLK